MEIQTRNIIIDTSYFVQNIFDFNKIELRKLRDLIDNGSAALFLTDITIAEVSKKIRELLPLAWKKLETGDGKYLKPIPVFKKILDKYNEEKVLEEVLSSFQNFLQSWNVQIISSREVNALHVYSMYAEVLPPFSDKKKKEFPDAFVLEAIRIWRDKTDKSAYLLSNDEDWKNYVEVHKKKLLGEFPTLFHLKELSPFIDSIIRKDEELKDQVKFADTVLDTNWLKIKERILTEFKNLGFDSDGTEDEEIINVYTLDCSLVESDILGTKDFVATYDLSLEIDVIVKYSIPDYSNAFYDKEDDRYYNLKYVSAYARQTLLEDCTIEFSYEDGLDSNFTISSLEFKDDNIRVPYDEDDFIDIEDWTKTLEVLVCGVQNGNFTDNGLGSMKFENIKRAKEVFPELDIYKQSEFFTAALGNKITESLRFETWKANEFYSS
ncbi:PIN domain-containing protein [Chryseobacterium sp. KACC 21268]|nr:PIN domain-containing protein [Chryseobacterium sp. KACC 21268]